MDICLADIYPEEETRSQVHYIYAPYLFISLGKVIETAGKARHIRAHKLNRTPA